MALFYRENLAFPENFNPAIAKDSDQTVSAEDYLQKPIEFDVLEVALKRIFKKRDLQRQNKQLQFENENLRRDIGLRYHITNSLGVSPMARTVLHKIRDATFYRNLLLIRGEYGLDKVDIARMIHYNSIRAANAFIVFECDKVPPDLQDVHLAGEERPTGGTFPGLFEKAHLGTLVLSNFHNLSHKCQPLLRELVLKDP